MNIQISDKTRETIDKEYSRFMADPNNLARLKMKLSYNQRVFIDTLLDTYNNGTDNLKAEDKLLLFQEAILSFNARPELVPNAPIDLLKKSLSAENTADEFEQLIFLIRAWRTSVNKSKRPLNRLGMFFGVWYKFLLYPFFVATLTATFTSLLKAGVGFLIFSKIDIPSIVVALLAGFVSLAAGRGIYFRLMADNIMNE